MTDVFETAPAGGVPLFDNPFDEAPLAAPPNPIQEEGGSRWMPHPETGVRTKFPRSSKYAGLWADEYVLNEWLIGMVTLGIGKTRGLYARANAEPIPEEPMEDRPKGWWIPFNEIGHEAIDAAEAKSGAHLGTAFHAWTEQIEAGMRDLKSIPPEWRKHIQAFMRMHEESGIQYVPEMREQIIVNLDVHTGLCGRFDALRLDSFGRLVVDDTKTGKNAPMGLDEIAIQLAIYANATHIWAPGQPDSVNGYIPMPENVRKDVSMISWVPINAPEKAEIIPVDIRWGWEAAQRISFTLAYRNRAKRIAGSRKGSLRLQASVLDSPDTLGPIGAIDKP